MEIGTLIARISASVDAGELAVAPLDSSFRTIETINDLLLPWSEVFPGIPEPEEGGSSDLFGWRGLRKPGMTPTARRSRRPLPAPRLISASPRLISPGLFASVQGIWAWYQAQDKADSKLIAQQFTEAGMQHFIQPLFAATESYWPMHVPLEMLFDEYHLANLPGIHLMLPHYSYEEEGSGVMEAFLSGVDGVASIMTHIEPIAGFDDLPASDLKLIKKIGYPRLLEAYSTYSGKKTYDLFQLQNWYETWFEPVKNNFPVQMETDWPIISGNAGINADVMIRSKEDIDFCFAYAEAYYEMMDHMPPPYDFETNDDGIASRFAAELCNAWRKTKNKPPETSKPQPITLAQTLEREAA